MALCTLPGVARPSTAFMPKILISRVFSVTDEPYLRDGVGCWEFCHGQGTGDLLREENSGRIFCFRLVLAKASVLLKQEKNYNASHPQTAETGLEESG